MVNRRTTLLLLIAGMLAIFIARALLAVRFSLLRTFDLFGALTVAGSFFVLLKGYRNLRRNDWMIALVLGAVVGIGMLFVTLFSPYPFFGIVRDNSGQA
jgi:hypothetical protein